MFSYNPLTNRFDLTGVSQETLNTAVSVLQGFKNKLINGNFRLWQRGPNFTDSGLYTADRWKENNAAPAFSYSRQPFALGQTDVPGEPQFFLRNSVTSASAGTSSVLRQFVEDVRTLAGQTATLSFWAKADVTKTFFVDINQIFGTGGSPSSLVTVVSTPIEIGTLWARHNLTVSIPSIAGKVLGTNGNDYIEVGLLEATNFSTYTLDLSNIQLEAGDKVTDFEQRPLGFEIGLAQQYFETSFSRDQFATATAAGSVRFKAHTTSHVQGIQFRVKKRVAPTMMAYNPSGGLDGTWRDFTASADRTVNFGDIGDSNARASVVSAVDGNSMGGHWVADAEL